LVEEDLSPPQRELDYDLELLSQSTPNKNFKNTLFSKSTLIYDEKRIISDVMNHILDVIDANAQLIDSSIAIETEPAQLTTNYQTKSIELSTLIEESNNNNISNNDDQDDSDIEVLTVSSNNRAKKST